jgi:alpha-L-fucosidase
MHDPIKLGLLLAVLVSALVSAQTTSAPCGGIAAIDREMQGLTHNSVVPRVIPSGPVSPNWDSIRAVYKTPQWLTDGKFGIFIHRELCSIPAYHNEWYSMHMYNGFADYHAKTHGPQNKFGYNDFIPMFRAEKYAPAAWAKLFHDAGAKYVVPVTELHDGLRLYVEDHGTQSEMTERS